MINRNMRQNDRRINQPACNQSNSSCQGNGNQGAGNGASCQALLRRLQALDFSIVDTVLYLDAYPDCQNALDYYRKLVSERDALKRSLAENCKRPVTNFENASNDAWDWTNGPWPWEAAAN